MGMTRLHNPLFATPEEELRASKCKHLNTKDILIEKDKKTFYCGDCDLQLVEYHPSVQ